MTLGFQSKLGSSMYAKMSRGQLESSLKLVESGPDTVMLTIQGTAHVCNSLSHSHVEILRENLMSCSDVSLSLAPSLRAYSVSLRVNT